jgi:flavin-dependent dehydrogenase
MDSDEGHAAAVGGMVSPGGVVAIGDSTTHIGSSPVIAIRRIDMDHRIVRAAQAAGAELIERFDVVEATLDRAAGLWTIGSGSGNKVQARALVAADGATSRLARRVGPAVRTICAGFTIMCCGTIRSSVARLVRTLSLAP